MNATIAHYTEKAMAQLEERDWQTAVGAADPKVPQRASLDELDESHPAVANAIATARRWAQRKRDGYTDASMVFSGPYGTGKTHIARAILWSIVDTPDGYADLAVPAGWFYLANDLLQRMAPHQDKETGMIVMPRSSNLTGSAPLVVIDDVGGQQTLPFIAAADQESELHARWFRFIDHCYKLQISVIMTTNLSIGGHESELARHLGGRAWDRLCEMAPAGFMVGLEGVPSWRVRQGGRS